MKRSSILSACVIGIACIASAGCGGGPSAPSSDEVKDFVEENPQLQEYNDSLAPLDNEGENPT